MTKRENLFAQSDLFSQEPRSAAPTKHQAPVGAADKPGKSVGKKSRIPQHDDTLVTLPTEDRLANPHLENGAASPCSAVRKHTLDSMRSNKKMAARGWRGGKKAAPQIAANCSSPIGTSLDRDAHFSPETKFLSVQRVARRYDASVASIWRWVSAGRFPAPRKLTSGTTRWSVADLEAYEANLRIDR